jgi:hypothetical protein
MHDDENQTSDERTAATGLAVPTPYQEEIARTVVRMLRWGVGLTWLGVALTVEGRSVPNITNSVSSAVMLSYMIFYYMPRIRDGGSRPHHAWVLGFLLLCQLASLVWLVQAEG